MATVDVPLGGFTGDGEPTFSADSIIFNGADGSGCEPFEIARVEFDRKGRESIFSFCKTEQAPYDICVQIALVVLKHHLNDAITINSNGDDSAWKAARTVCQKVLGYGVNFKLDAH